jgi:hypothetical protein
MELLRSTSSFIPARAIAMIFLGENSIKFALGQEAEQVPHWIHAFIASPPGMREISRMKSAALI